MTSTRIHFQAPTHTQGLTSEDDGGLTWTDKD